MMKLCTRHCSAATIGALFAVVLGCSGSSGPRCYPVRGRVMLGEQPVTEARVVFHPLAGQTLDGPMPIAQTDAEGRFELTTLNTGDGAPAGEYAIVIELREPRLVGEEYVRDGRHLLPERYADPANSGLKHTVAVGSNEIPPLVLLPQ